MKVQEPARGGSAEKQSPRRPGGDGVDISSGQRSAVSHPAGPTSLVGNPHLSWDSAMKRKRDRAGGELRTPMCLRAPMCLLTSFLCFKAKCPQATPCGQCLHQAVGPRTSSPFSPARFFRLQQKGQTWSCRSDQKLTFPRSLMQLFQWAETGA